MKRFLLSALFLMITMLSMAQQKYYAAFINDPDGYTNIRQGKSSKSAVVFQMHKYDLFYVKKDAKSDWWPVYFEKGGELMGYIHKSRVKMAVYHPDIKCVNCGKKGVYIKCPHGYWYCSNSCSAECDY